MFEILTDKLAAHFAHLNDTLLIEVLFLIAIIWSAGKIFNKFKLPPVIGELVAGIIIGPPILGLFSETPSIALLAKLGSFFLMFFAGLEVDIHILRKIFKRVFMISFLGTAIPFVVGFYVSYIYLGNIKYALFIAITVSATAIAVTERLLTNIKLPNPSFKTTLIGAAAFTDLLVLVILSIILTYSNHASPDIFSVIFYIIKIILFVGIVNFIGLVLYPKYAPRYLTPEADGFTFAILIAFIIGFIGESLGFHFVFGAFLAGLFVHEELTHKETFTKTKDRIYSIAHGFLGPIFFFSIAFSFSFIHLKSIIGFLTLLIILATISKTLGGSLGACLSGTKLRNSLSYGAGMNGRATIALIIGTVGLSEGIINEQVFSIIVAVAIITTMITPMLLSWSLSLYKKKH